ncbi:MAG: hydrogenase expression/formation protein [Chloroflexi bacterium]|nr:hydrogenase expression/formation protein [Chloroflexota bacterium]
MRLDVGKLPNELLARLLSRLGKGDPRVVVGPGIGQDAAVIDMGDRPGGRPSGRYLVAKTDPITFATDLIGWYAVHINANDVACMGATPRWFMVTVLLPEGAEAALAETIFEQVAEACEGMGVALVGGHTEITHRLERPVVVGAMLGEVERERLVTCAGARPGDALILTKGIAIEGTAVLAREAEAGLRALGVSDATVAAAKQYVFEPGISVVKEAAAACRAARIHAMHDPTEGGLATALYELAAASQASVEVDAGKVRVLPATQEVCRAAGLDPLGLLASGSLLIAVAEEDAGPVLAALEAEGVPAVRIGAIVAKGRHVIMVEHERKRPVPRFDRDEVARFLAGRGSPTPRAGEDRGAL